MKTVSRDVRYVYGKSTALVSLLVLLALSTLGKKIEYPGRLWCLLYLGHKCNCTRQRDWLSKLVADSIAIMPMTDAGSVTFGVVAQI